MDLSLSGGGGGFFRTWRTPPGYGLVIYPHEDSDYGDYEYDPIAPALRDIKPQQFQSHCQLIFFEVICFILVVFIVIIILILCYMFSAYQF